MEIIPPPKELQRPLYVPNKTLMGPGPTNISQRVLNCLSNPILGHMHPECFQIMDEIKEGIRYLFQTRNDATMCISGSGHAGMEAALCNLVEEKDIVLVAITGLWGERAAEMTRRYGGNVRLLKSKPGCSMTLKEIEIAFELHKPKIFFITQGDSSTGILQHNLKEIGELCQYYDSFFVVDCVASIGGTEFFMDYWLIDVAYCCSQKTIGAPPGITPISFSPRSIDHIKSRLSPPKVFYFDVNLLGQYWNCFENIPRIYHHTISTTLLYGLREALAHLCSQGLEATIKRHQEASQRLQQGLIDLGLEMFVEEPCARLATINAIKVPVGVDCSKVCEYAMKKYNLEIGGGLGVTDKKIFRIGLMGENTTNVQVDLTINILHEAIQSVKLNGQHFEVSKI